MHESTHIPGAGNGGQENRVQNTCAIQTRKLSQYIAKSAGKSNRINFLGGNFPQDSLYLFSLLANVKGKKTDVSSVSPSSERLEEWWVVCGFICRKRSYAIGGKMVTRKQE